MTRTFNQALAIALAFLLIGGAAAAPLGAGDRPPARLGLDSEGEFAETAKYAGKVLMVTFWAT